MAQCPFNNRIDAYYDGELAPPEAAELFAHRTSCVECSNELAWRKSMSELFAASAPAGLSQMGLHRLHQGVGRVMSERLVRMAHFVQAIAATILLAASILMARGGPATTNPNTELATFIPSTPPWVEAAMTSESDTTNAVNSPAATWYLAMDSSRSDETP